MFVLISKCLFNMIFKFARIQTALIIHKFVYIIIKSTFVK